MYTSIAHKIPDHSSDSNNIQRDFRAECFDLWWSFETSLLLKVNRLTRARARVVPTSLTSLQWEACPPTAASGWEFIGKCDSHELTYYNCRLVTAEWKKSPFRIGAFQKPCTPSLSRCKMTMVRMFSWLGRDCFWKMSRVKTSTRCDILCSRILISFIFC